MWQEICDLFSGYSIIPLLFMFAGIVMLCVQMFLMNFNLLGIIGVVFSIGGIITRMMMNGTLIHFLIMTIFMIVVLLIVFIVAKQSKSFNITSDRKRLNNDIQAKLDEINKTDKN